MGDPKSFMIVPRKDGGYRPKHERISDYGEVEQTLNAEDRRLQASRCMACGTPFCHWACSVGSTIPEWQDALYRKEDREAYEILHSTNSFPEFTGRVCPALCEKSCVLAIHSDAVTIRENECSVVETAFEKGFIVPNPPSFRTGKKVAVIGSGPSGLSVADLLNRDGHKITVFEKNETIGGLLRLGIPDFKLSKAIIDRRLNIFKAEGIDFKTNVCVGKDITKDELLSKYDAVVLAMGAGSPRDLKIEGRELKGVHYALELLQQQNRINAGKKVSAKDRICAEGKHVLIIGGGDTGSDCVGTSIRQKALSVTQIEIMPKPPEERQANNPWPYWPTVLRTSCAHLEGCTRRWSLSTKRLIGENGAVKQAEVVQVEWNKDKNGRWMLSEVPGTNEIIPAELIMICMGFTQPVHKGLLDELGVEYDARGNVKVNEQKQTSVNKVFAAGDVEKGSSLVVRAIHEGRVAAASVSEFLKK